MDPEAADIATAAERAAARAAAIAAKAQSTYDSEIAAAQIVSQENHFWRAIMAWCNKDEDCDCLREDSRTFMCEDTNLVSASWLTAADAALTAQGYTVVRDAGAKTFTVSLPA